LTATELALLAVHGESLRELCNVSGLFLSEAAEPSVRVQMASELGWKKCERCWHWEPNVGVDPEHPTICARCVEAVKTHAVG
jgi:isoleucyl-tRNA synthetase